MKASIKYPHQAIIKNCLVILYSKKSFLPEEQKLYNRMCKEIQISREEMLQYFGEWQKAPKNLVCCPTLEENHLALSFMMAAAYFDNMVYSGERDALIAFCKLAGIPETVVTGFLAKTWNFSFFDGVIDDVFEIQKNLGFSENREAELPVEVRKTASSSSEYVATQVSSEGIDELQALYLCYKLNLNAALSGPPGVGKTESVLELSRILEVPLFTKVCSSRTTESHIISHPVLMEKNGVTITAHEDGALCRAMQAPGIFYGDEYNLLKEDVQKRMNSAFDDRRSIDRNDGTTVNSRAGFMAIISYNPSDNMGIRDLEDSVADRFVHFHYTEWPTELKAYISVLKADRKMGKPIPDHNNFGVTLVKRGFDSKGNFLEQTDGVWVDFFTGKPVQNKPNNVYYCMLRKHLGDRSLTSQNMLDTVRRSVYDYPGLSHALARFVGTVNELTQSGKGSYLSNLGLGDKSDDEDFEPFMVHSASTRIITSALMHNQFFSARSWHPYLAQSYASNLIINQMAYGTYRTQKLRDINNLDVLQTVARSMELFHSNVVYNTDMKTRGSPSGTGAAKSTSRPSIRKDKST